MGRSAANPPHAAAAVDRWNRETDRRTTLDRFIDPAAHTLTIYIYPASHAWVMDLIGGFCTKTEQDFC